MDQSFLDADGLVKVVHQSFVDALPVDELRYYCHVRAIYTIVTHELLRLLNQFLESHASIEIGAGNGTLARGLGIRATDNKMQELPMVQLQYAKNGQPTIQYPKDVEKLDAIAAIKKYRPKVVIGSWITSSKANILPIPEIEFPNEERIMELCDTYVLIGNLKTHKNNLLWNTKKYKQEFLDGFMNDNVVRSRATDPDKDFIVAFTKK